MASRPWTDADDARLSELHGKGLSLNAAAKELGRSPGTVSPKAKALGLSWDRANVEAANRARSADSKARRLALQDRALAAAEGIYDTIEAATYKRIFKGQYGTESVREIDFIPPNERRDLAATATQHVAISIRLAMVDDDKGVDVARSMLGRLAMDVGGQLGVDIRSKIELQDGDPRGI